MLHVYVTKRTSSFGEDPRGIPERHHVLAAGAARVTSVSDDDPTRPAGHLLKFMRSRSSHAI